MNSNHKEQRLGKFTASQIYRLMTNPRSGSGLSVGAITYIEEVARDILAYSDEQYEPEFTNIHTDRGHARELAAVANMEMELGLCFSHTGDDQRFFEGREGFWGASPDGVVFDKNGDVAVTLDVKSPTRLNHIKNVLQVKDMHGLKASHKDYYWQKVAQITACNAERGYWVSYNPMIKNLDRVMHYIEIVPPSEDVEAMINKLSMAKSYLDEVVDRFNK